MKKNAIPKVCAIGAVYRNDKPEYLFEALDSVIKQTFQVDSVYLVVDGPIGLELEQVLIKFKNVIKLHRLEKSIGLGLALNELLISKIYRKYDFGIRFDADDINLENRFKELVKTIIDYDLDLCGSFVKEIDDSKTKLGIRKTPLNFPLINLAKNFVNPFNHPSVIYRLDFLEQIGGYEDCPYHEDWLLWLKFLKKSRRVKNIAEPLVLFRLNEGTFKRRFNSDFNQLERFFYAKAIKRNLINPFLGCIALCLRQATRLFGKKFYKYVYKKIRNIW